MTKKTNDVPMGASKWKAHGLRYGYWNFFETQIRKDWKEEIDEEMRKFKEGFAYKPKKKKK